MDDEDWEMMGELEEDEDMGEVRWGGGRWRPNGAAMRLCCAGWLRWGSVMFSGP